RQTGPALRGGLKVEGGAPHPGPLLEGKREQSKASAGGAIEHAFDVHASSRHYCSTRRLQPPRSPGPTSASCSPGQNVLVSKEHQHGADFIVGSGEMADLIRRKDWARTPLGAIDSW